MGGSLDRKEPLMKQYPSLYNIARKKKQTVANVLRQAEILVGYGSNKVTIVALLMGTPSSPSS